MKKVLCVFLLLALIFCETVPAFALCDSMQAGQTQTICMSSTGYGTSYGYIDTEGNLWMWGENNNGCLGQPLSVDRLDSPTLVMSGVAAFKVNAGSTIVLKTDGTAWTWGYDYNHGVREAWNSKPGNEKWTLGYGPEPYKVGDHVAAVSVGSNHQFGILKDDGTLWTWGYDYVGDLGYVPYDVNLPDSYYVVGGLEEGQSVADNRTPTKPYKIMDGVKAFAMGYNNGMAIKTDNTLWYWGCDPWVTGKAASYAYAPMKILDNVSSFTIGYHVVGAVLTNGQFWQWGGAMGVEPSLIPLAKRKKVMDNVKFAMTDYTDIPTLNDDNRKISYDQTYIVTTDDKLYGMSGKEYLMDNVVCVSNSLFLKKDGTLYERKAVYNDIDEYNREFDHYEVVRVADGVAMPGQPFSSLRKKIGNFIDVREGDWFAGPVEWAVERSITAGTTPTTFSPNQTCTTAQILTFLWVAAGQNQPKEDNPFSDVSEANYFYRPALWASENGLVDGSVFGGDTPCTRAAVVTYLWKLAGSPETAVSSQFTDVPADAEYAQAVAWAVKEGVTAGLSANTFGPDNICTRAQIVTFLKAALD